MAEIASPHDFSFKLQCSVESPESINIDVCRLPVLCALFSPSFYPLAASCARNTPGCAFPAPPCRRLAEELLPGSCALLPRQGNHRDAQVASFDDCILPTQLSAPRNALSWFFCLAARHPSRGHDIRLGEPSIPQHPHCVPALLMQSVKGKRNAGTHPQVEALCADRQLPIHCGLLCSSHIGSVTVTLPSQLQAAHNKSRSLSFNYPCERGPSAAQARV